MIFTDKKIIPVVLAMLLVAGCGGDNSRPEYQGAESYKSLELPPDLTLDRSRNEMAIPEPTESALNEFREKHKLSNVVTPEFSGIRLKHEGNMYFLEVDVPPETAWRKIESFWENEGITLIQNDPLLGFMQTGWTKQLQYKKDSGYIKKLFSKLEPDLRDKFRMRIEPAEDRTKTHIFIAHYGIEVFVEGGEDDTAIHWRGRKSDIELEREILSRLALFAGVSEGQADELLKDYKPFQSYVTYVEDMQEGDDKTGIEYDRSRVAELSMRGSMDFVWYRAIRALDRLQMEEITLNRKKGEIRFTVPANINLSTADTDEEVDEIAESSWLMNLFTGKKDEEEGASKGAVKYTLQLVEKEGHVVFGLFDNRGMEADTVQASQFRAAFARALE